MKNKFKYSIQLLVVVSILLLLTNCNKEESDCTSVAQPEYELVE